MIKERLGYSAFDAVKTHLKSVAHIYTKTILCLSTGNLLSECRDQNGSFRMLCLVYPLLVLCNTPARYNSLIVVSPTILGTKGEGKPIILSTKGKGNL